MTTQPCSLALPPLVGLSAELRSADGEIVLRGTIESETETEAVLLQADGTRTAAGKGSFVFDLDQIEARRNARPATPPATAPGRPPYRALVDAVRTATDIVAVIGRTVELVPDAGTFRGRCPFHPDAAASFRVAPTARIFHCRACGEGGDVFAFLMKTRTLSYREAVETCAGESGIPMVGEPPRAAPSSLDAPLLDLGPGFPTISKWHPVEREDRSWVPGAWYRFWDADPPSVAAEMREAEDRSASAWRVFRPTGEVYDAGRVTAEECAGHANRATAEANAALQRLGAPPNGRDALREWAAAWPAHDKAETEARALADQRQKEADGLDAAVARETDAELAAKLREAVGFAREDASMWARLADSHAQAAERLRLLGAYARTAPTP